MQRLILFSLAALLFAYACRVTSDYPPAYVRTWEDDGQCDTDECGSPADTSWTVEQGAAAPYTEEFCFAHSNSDMIEPGKPRCISSKTEALGKGQFSTHEMWLDSDGCILERTYISENWLEFIKQQGR
jgi:hypothetical protein